MALLDEVGALVHQLQFADLPPEAVACASEAMLDTLGVTLVGAPSDCAAIVRDTLGGALGAEGAATVIGTRLRASILDAALANGVAAHALEFDDSCNTLCGHPSAPILPGLWALGESLGASGRDLILAYVAGFEVESKLARAIQFGHFERGWHSSATQGAVGGAAACAKLMGLSADQIATAMACATSMASGMRAHFGTMMKPFDIGQTNRNGLMAALIASRGLSANHAALEHQHGFFNLFNGKDNHDPARITAGWGAPFDILEPGIAFKQHPCCGGAHSILDAFLDLRRTYGLRPAQIARIEGYVHPRRLANIDRPDPATETDAASSAQYVLACAAVHGSVRLDQFTLAAMAAPEVRRLTHANTVAAKPGVPMSADHNFGEVRVVMADGGELTAGVDQPVGRDRAHPLPEGVLQDKFRGCAGALLPQDSVERLIGQCAALEKIPDIRAIFDTLRDGLEIGRVRRATA